MTRQQQLLEKCGRRLASLFAVFAKARPPAIDVVMDWPPEDGLVTFLISLAPDDRDWDFKIPSRDWRLDGEPKDEVPARLAHEIRAFFRAIWSEVSPKFPETQAYFRLHDDISAVNLRTGKSIRDAKRPDLQKPRKPFTKPSPLPRNRRPDRELICRGDSVEKVQKVYGETNPPKPLSNVYYDAWYRWPKLGVSIHFKKRKVVLVDYFALRPQNLWGLDRHVGVASRSVAGPCGRGA